MIVRILGEGQWEVAESHVSALNLLDAKVENAVSTRDHEGFAQHLTELLGAIRTAGVALPDDSLVKSDMVLPPSDASLEEVRVMLGDDGLIPG